MIRTKKSTVYFEGAEGEVICEVGGGPICRRQGVDGFGTRKHDKYQANTNTPESVDTSNINKIFSKK